MKERKQLFTQYQIPKITVLHNNDLRRKLSAADISKGTTDIIIMQQYEK